MCHTYMIFGFVFSSCRKKTLFVLVPNNMEKRMRLRIHWSPSESCHAEPGQRLLLEGTYDPAAAHDAAAHGEDHHHHSHPAPLRLWSVQAYQTQMDRSDRVSVPWEALEPFELAPVLAPVEGVRPSFFLGKT